MGADLAGLVDAGPLQEAAAYDRWVAAGMHGSMGYMQSRAATRREIQLWYPEARSVLLCGFFYATNEPEPPQPGRGRIARYARLRDYHPELKRRLESLVPWLRQRRSGADGRVFVDTSPVLERLYARYAGLGWIGKNTMLIAPRRGSYFFLAGLALNLDLPADPAETDHCGSCRRCIDACPTKAFPAERVLDASRCVSYFTIERRGAIPEDFREGVGDWVFGCDICQEVCPWNRFSRPGTAFPAPGDGSLDLEEAAGLDEAAFKARFAGTPLSRAKRRGLARNAALAMGNARDKRHLQALQRAACDPDPVVREQARWSLRCLPPPTKK